MKFLLLCLGYTISLLIFQAGFLLKRKEIHIRSTCRDAPTGSNNCWMKPQYNKVILMIVDALRHDFILPQSDTNIAPYLNQMKFAASLANSSILSSIIADPPTTTLQRLKGITTGTLPTFIDVSDNFSPNANINEDNIIDQLISKGLNATLIGDDTWVSLYPDRFHRSYPMSSFDVHDLHGVDDEVLPEELARTDTQFLILHFLGVDHCGHRYGPDHPEMAKKLRQMDTTIEYIVKRMRQDELLVVMGDHGMTTTGDHGGEAFAEITAGLLIHSPSTAFQTPTLPPRQIDLLPSLSLLLGLPIPFSNLGNVIPELFPVELQRKLAVQLNYEQVIRFARTYSSSNALSLSEFSLFDDRDLDENDQLKTLQRIQQALRAAWTQFDTTIIIVGLVSIAECILYNLSDEPSSFTQWIVRSGLLLLQFSAFFGGSENPSVPLLLGTLVILSIFHLLRIIKLATLIRSRSKMMTNLLFTILPCLCFFSNSFIVRETDVLRFFLQTLVILSLAIKTSSWKKKLGGGKMNVKILRQLVFSDEALIPILMIGLLRLAPFFHRCREEEINCVQYFPTILSASLPGDIRVMRLLLSIFSSSTLSYLIGQRAHWLLGNFFGDTISINRAETASATRLTQAFVSLELFAVYFNWALDLTQHNDDNVKFALLVTSWVVYGIFGLVLLINIFTKASATNETSALGLNLNILHSLIPVLLLLLGDGMAPGVAIFTFLTLRLPTVVHHELLQAADTLLLALGFYFLGHSPTLTAIPWTAAFVGISGAWGWRILPALLILSHLYASTLLVCARLLIQQPVNTSLLIATVAVRALASSAACAILRRHLMVWKIFAPRFIFESIGFLVLLGVVSIFSFLRRRFIV